MAETPRRRIKKKKKGAYHHGDLRRALIDGAIALVREQGLSGWTLRGVARQAGVSHAAPYHHFADKEALLGAITALGFQQLGDAMAAAVAASAEQGENLIEQFEALGRAYLRFGATHRGLYQVMFREVRSEEQGTEEGRAAGVRAMEIQVGLMRAAQEAGLIPAGDPRKLLLPAWSMLHGWVSLAVLGPLPGLGLTSLAERDAQIEAIARSAVQSMTGG